MTESRQAEAEAYRFPEHLRSLMQALIDASITRAVLLDSRGIILAANQALAEGLGLTVPKMIGRRVFDLFLFDATEKVRRRLSGRCCARASRFASRTGAMAGISVSGCAPFPTTRAA